MRAIEDISLLELIPQRPPFVMVDRLLSCKETVTTSQLDVREENIFVFAGHLSAEGLVENIAQTCALRIGYLNDSVKLGVIGAVSNFEVLRTPRVGEQIETTIDVLEEMFNITLVKAVVRCGDEPIAEANMKIALMDTEIQA